MPRLIATSLTVCLTLALMGCGKNEPAPVATTPQPGTGAATVLTAASADLALDVEGMHCQGCANGLAKVWAKLDGVSDCQVSFAEKRGYLKLADDTDIDAVVAAIEADLDPTYTVTKVATGSPKSELKTPDTHATH